MTRRARSAGNHKRSAVSRSLPRAPRTLAIDIGGSGIKLLVLDARGRPAGERRRLRTPQPATPQAVLQVIRETAAELGPFERVAAGFPGIVQSGVVTAAPNLAPGRWRRVNLRAALERLLGRPARVANDAVVQGYGAIRGAGLELVLTLGTGVGSALFLDGRAIALELGHHPWRDGRTYEQLLGDEERRRTSGRVWSARVGKALGVLQAVFRPDVVYLGGGNAVRLQGRLPHGVQVVDNMKGLLGGFRLWLAGAGTDPGDHAVATGRWTPSRSRTR